MLRIRENERIGILLAVFAVLLFQASVATAGTKEKVAEIRSKVTVEQAYELDTEVELTLGMEEAARLTCGENPYGLEEILICPSSGWLFQYCLWSNGNISGGGRNLRELKFLQAYPSATSVDPTGKWKGFAEWQKILAPLFWGKIPVAVSEQWRLQEGKVILKYRIVTNPDEVLAALRAVLPRVGQQKQKPPTMKQLVEELRRRASSEQAYVLGGEIQITVAKGKALRLVCSENPHGLKEALLGWLPLQGKELLFIYVVTKDAGINGGGSELPTIKGAYRQIFETCCLTAATWEIKDERCITSFQIQTDKARNSELLKRFREMPKANVSRMIKNEAMLTGQLPTLTPLEQVAGFVQLWSEVKYNFAFFDQVPDVDWDQVLVEWLPKFQEEQTTYEYYRSLQKCIAQLQDGHTRVRGGAPPEIRDRPALLVQPVEGKAIVVALAETEELLSVGIKKGDEITLVDGSPVKEIIEKELYPYISASTPQARDREAYYRLLEGPRGSQVSLRVRNSKGEMRNVVLTRQSEGISRPWTHPPLLEWRELSDGLVYVALNSFRRETIVEQFDEIFGKIRQAKGVILDVRENGGGDSSIGYRIIGRLIDKPLKSSRWKTRQYMPAFRAWGSEEKWYEGRHDSVEPRGEEPFLGPVAVLIGPGTVSAAEDFLIPLHASGRTTLVGERTAGTTGQPLTIRLPGGGSALICTKRDTYPDGREFVGIGIIPDVEAHPTQKDIATGRDVVLEKGLEVLKGQLQK